MAEELTKNCVRSGEMYCRAGVAYFGAPPALGLTVLLHKQTITDKRTTTKNADLFVVALKRPHINIYCTTVQHPAAN